MLCGGIVCFFFLMCLYFDAAQKWEMDFEDQRKQKEAEMRRRFPLEKRFQQQLVGQEGAINVVASGVYYSLF